MKTLTSALITCFLAVFVLTVISPAPAQPQMYFIHNDHLGTPQAVTDENQQIVWRGGQQPSGQTKETTDTIQQNARFPGQYLDEESGLHYNYFRDYDPSVGRYIQSDPIGLLGGINTYGYADSNPLAYIDPEGLAYSPQGEHGISREEAGLNGGKDPNSCGCLSKFLGVGTASGATAVVAGQPTIPYPRSGVDAHNSTGKTSPASKWGRKIFGNKRISRIPTPTNAGARIGTGSVGGAFGRAVPGVGYSVLGYQYAKLLACLAKCNDCQK